MWVLLKPRVRKGEGIRRAKLIKFVEKEEAEKQTDKIDEKVNICSQKLPWVPFK